MTTQKTLSELLEAVEPDIIYHTTGDLVHCADYERMRGVAIELAKALEYARDSYELVGYELVGGDGAPSGHLPYPADWTFADKALSRAKDIIGRESE